MRLRPLIIGTAGHIDHGKTSLVARLTGINTDRLPEEKLRGISIDIGFAHFDAQEFRFGIVDVPGHERFVHNMVAGATGVDLALLVVAADDGVMPQTSEHLEIMDLLGIRGGVVAITKVDMVDRDMVELVMAELEERLKSTFLAGAPVVGVSSHTGEGIDQLIAALVGVARQLPAVENDMPFRMPIDRVFSVPGHGTVVTGSILGGAVQAGDTVELLPDQRPLRVRGVQSHGHQVDSSASHRRTAVNLAGIKIDELHRGQELAAPGYLSPARRMLVRVQCLSSAPAAIKDRATLQLHLGTAQVAARLILKGAPLPPGGRVYAELRTAAPIVATYDQRFILRRASPPLTLAGGVILDPAIEARQRLADLEACGAALDTPDELSRLSLYFAHRDDVDRTPLPAASLVGISPGRYASLVEQLGASGQFVRLGPKDSGRMIHRKRLETLAEQVLRRIRSELKLQQPRRALPKPMLIAACRRIAGADLVEAAFELLATSKRIVAVGPNYGPADQQVQLTRNQSAALAGMLEQFTAAGRSPPTVKELAASLQQKADVVATLLNLCVEDGLLVRVSDELYYTPGALEEARQICAAALAGGQTATVAQLREAWGVSRKYAVPLVEWFDSRGITQRQGDERRAGSKIAEPLSA